MCKPIPPPMWNIMWNIREWVNHEKAPSGLGNPLGARGLVIPSFPPWDPEVAQAHREAHY